MSDSLKDQLMKLGFKSPARQPGPARKAQPKHDHRKSSGAGGQSREPGGAEIDLAKAYAIRARKEKDERIAAERQRQELARQRREGKAKLTTLLQHARLNDDKADIARHFQYGGKIRRIYVTAEQLVALNAGELAVVQLAGGYHLVSAAHGEEAESCMPGSLALAAGSAEPVVDANYDDSRYQVPDDLIW